MKAAAIRADAHPHYQFHRSTAGERIHGHGAHESHTDERPIVRGPPRSPCRQSRPVGSKSAALDVFQSSAWCVAPEFHRCACARWRAFDRQTGAYVAVKGFDMARLNAAGRAKVAREIYQFRFSTMVHPSIVRASAAYDTGAAAYIVQVRASPPASRTVTIPIDACSCAAAGAAAAGCYTSLLSDPKLKGVW